MPGEWEREGKDSSFLLRGKDLREAEQWVAKSADLDPKPTTLQSQYILASRQAATKQQRIVLGAVAVAFLIAVGLAVYAFREKKVADANADEAGRQKVVAQQRQKDAEDAAEREKKALDAEAIARKQAELNARKANTQENIAKQRTVEVQKDAAISRSRELVASSILNEDSDPELSVLLAAHAVAATWPWGHSVLPEADDQLHRAIKGSHVRYWNSTKTWSWRACRWQCSLPIAVRSARR